MNVRSAKIKKVKVGIEAGYKQIIKISEIVLSTLVLFTVIAYTTKGPSLTREIVSIVKK